MKVLVTGGTGHLGRDVVALRKQDGHDVRVLARRPGGDADIEWVRGDLATGEGIGAAVHGVDSVLHAATNSPAARRGFFKLGDFFRSPSDVDVHGTRALLAAAEEMGVERFIHVSIVGLSHLRRVPYSRRKLEAEALVRGSGLTWSIVRATGFYWLLARMCESMLGQRPLALPARAQMAPVASEDFAEFVVECASDGQTGERVDFAGPDAQHDRVDGAVPRRSRPRAPSPPGAVAETDAEGVDGRQHVGQCQAWHNHLGAVVAARRRLGRRGVTGGQGRAPAGAPAPRVPIAQSLRGTR